MKFRLPLLRPALHEADRRLARRMVRGDEEAFEDFFSRYFPGLFRFARAQVESDAEAEDIAQATLVKAIDKLSSYRGEASLFSWLCTFCRREIWADAKSAQRRPEPMGLVEDLPEVWAALSSTLELETPEAETLRRDVARWVRVTLDHLPARYGQALEWKYLEEMSVKEIARRLDVAPKAAESLLTRARVAFRDHFLSVGAAQALPGAEP